MKIAILGSGSVGQAFATRLIELGHQVMIGTRNVEQKKVDEKFSVFLSKNSDVKLGTFKESAVFGEMAMNVSKGATTLELLQSVGEAPLSGKLLIDISNPLDFSKGMPPTLIPELCNTNSLGEEMQKRFPGALVIKTLNTMWNGLMVNPNLIGKGEHVNYICGNDAEAKKKAVAFLKELGWREDAILDLGDITAARATEGVLPIWLRVYSAKKSGAFNFRIITD